MSEGDRSRGIYPKYWVCRADGSDALGEKHHGCRHFVLDPRHDQHARPALKAYADSCRADGYSILADDIESWLREISQPDEEAPC